MMYQDNSEQLIDKLQQRIAELEEASQKKDTEAAFVLKMAPLGIHECDTDGRIIFVNPCQERITGYTAEELIGTYIWDRIEPGPQKESLPDYLKHLVSEQPAPIPFVARNIRKNGELYEIRVDWNYKRNPQEQVTGFVCIISDVTEQKRIAAALQKSEECFRKVFEEGPLGVVLLGLDARIQHCNRRFCEMLGYSEEEIIALGLVGITHSDDWERDRQLVSRLLCGEIPTYTIDKRYVRKGGTVFRGQLTVSMMHDAEGKPTTVIGMIEDISERKRAEELLQENERMLRTLMDASPESILLLDTEGTVLIVNETAARRLGKTADEITGRKAHTLMPLELAVERTERFQEVIRTGKAIRFQDMRSEQYFETAMHPILDKQRKVVAVAVLGIDRTEWKHVEEALKQAHDELEQRVEERTAELTNANEELIIFRQFAEASGEGFGMSELDGRIAYVNSTLCRLFGETTRQDVIGKQVFTYYPEEYVSKRKNEILPALLQKGGYWHAEQTVLPRHGEPIQTSQSTFLIRDENGNPFRIAVVISDITERKLAEEALRREHRTLNHLLQSSDHERQLIAYEIHDGLAQQLAGAIMQFQTYFHQKEHKPKEASKAFDAGMTMLQQGHFEARRLIAGVRPPILDESGVVAAIGHLVNEQNRLQGPSIEYRSRVAFTRLAPIVENAIYRIVQEGLTNACQHSKSDKVRVSLVQRRDRVRIEIRDWGIGFDVRTRHENCFGLEGIRQRSRLLGGKCNIKSKKDKGTRIAFELPVVVRE
jgi:PAS domain S-box-containing protein